MKASEFAIPALHNCRRALLEACRQCECVIQSSETVRGDGDCDLVRVHSPLPEVVPWPGRTMGWVLPNLFPREAGLSLNAGDAVESDIYILGLSEKILWVKRSITGLQVSFWDSWWLGPLPNFKEAEAQAWEVGEPFTSSRLSEDVDSGDICSETGMDLLKIGELASRAAPSRGGLNPLFPKSVEVFTIEYYHVIYWWLLQRVSENEADASLQI